MLASTARAPEREPYFRFTATYESFPVVIVARTDTPLLPSIQDLVGRTIATARDYAPTLDLQREYPGIRLMLTDTVDEAMRLVAAGKADAVVTNLANASFVIKTGGLTDLRIAGTMPHDFALRYAVRSDWPELAGILDKGIASLTPADLQSINDRWIRIDYVTGVRWDVIGKPVMAMVLGVAIVIALIIVRSRRLAYELAQRTRLQVELEDSRDRLTQLNEEKAELLRMAAHDLRGPLTGVLLNLDLAQQGGIKADDALPRIRNHVEQMIMLMTDLLDSETLDEGRRKLTFHGDPSGHGGARSTGSGGVCGRAQENPFRYEWCWQGIGRAGRRRRVAADCGKPCLQCAEILLAGLHCVARVDRVERAVCASKCATKGRACRSTRWSGFLPNTFGAAPSRPPARNPPALASPSCGSSSRP